MIGDRAQEKIERFLAGEMTFEEEQRFRRQLASDGGLRRRLQFEKSAVAAMRRNRERLPYDHGAAKSLAMAALVAAASAPGSNAPEPLPPPPGGRRWGWFAAGGVALLLTSAGGYLALSPAEGSPPIAVAPVVVPALAAPVADPPPAVLPAIGSNAASEPVGTHDRGAAAVSPRLRSTTAKSSTPAATITKRSEHAERAASTAEPSELPFFSADSMRTQVRVEKRIEEKRSP